jgi:hypothetical protein
MKVFISYGNAGDQATALRLQALGAVNGLAVYVPPAYTRQGAAALIDADSAKRLADAEMVLGVIGATVAEACRLELNSAMTMHKDMLVMASPQSASFLQGYFPSNLVVIDPANPEQTEREIVQHLRAVNAEKNAQRTLVALGTLAFGLLMFAAAD